MRHEAETIADLTHPNLAALFDAGRCAQGPYLVYELLDGARLSDRLTAQPLAPRRRRPASPWPWPVRWRSPTRAAWPITT